MGAEIIAIIVGVSISVVASLIIFLCRKITKFITKVTKGLDKIDELEKGVEKQKRFTILNVESAIILMEAMKGAKINGSVEQIRKRFLAELNEEAVN